MLIDIFPRHGIDARLITLTIRSTSPEPLNHVGIETQSELPFHRSKENTAPSYPERARRAGASAADPRNCVADPPIICHSAPAPATTSCARITTQPQSVVTRVGIDTIYRDKRQMRLT